MALQSFGRMLWPSPVQHLGFTGISSSTSYQINGTGHRIGWVFPVPMTGTITKAGVRIHTCATAVTSRIGIYTVDGSGNPTTTGYGGSATPYGTFTPAANTYFEVTLGASCSATAGDTAALVVEFDSTAGDMFVSGMNGTTMTAMGYPNKFSGTWGKVSFGGTICGHIFYSDSGGTYPDIGIAPFTGAVATANYNSGSTPDEYALRVTLPFTARVAGIWHNFATAAGADYEAILYTGTTAQATEAVDGDFAGGTTQHGIRHAIFPTPYTVTAGTTVRAAIRPTTANNVTYRRYTVFAANSEQSLGMPQGTCQSTRTDLGAWSDTTTIVPSIGLIIDQLDDGVGGGGAAIPLIGGGLIL